MGSIRKDLFRTQLPNRELHHSRLFIDLAENIHIHHREYRTVFSLDEYFEYADIISKSTEDVRNFLEQNPNYEEHKYPTTIMKSIIIYFRGPFSKGVFGLCVGTLPKTLGRETVFNRGNTSLEKYSAS